MLRCSHQHNNTAGHTKFKLFCYSNRDHEYTITGGCSYSCKQSKQIPLQVLEMMGLEGSGISTVRLIYIPSEAVHTFHLLLPVN